MSSERYTVRVGKDNLLFSAAHFISYDGHQCERLHGHNYRAAVEVEAPLTPDFYVFDFLALKDRAKEITDALDHHMLLATENPVIRVEPDPARVRVTYKDREWVFPSGDCVLLPIENTTAELLARHIAMKLIDVLRDRHHFAPARLGVEVEENVGQSATIELQPTHWSV